MLRGPWGQLRVAKRQVQGGGGRTAMADAPRGVDPCRLPTKWRLPALHPVWLPKGAPLALPVPPLVLTTGPPPHGLEALGGGGGSDTATLLADLANHWARALSVDEPSTLDASAILSWCPYTKAQYGSRLRALASYAVRTSPPTIAEALASVLAERTHMGATASSIRGFTSAVRPVEDLQWIPPAVTILHKRIAAEAALYNPPTGLVILVENVSESMYGPLLGALAALAWVCFLPVGEVATIQVANIVLLGTIRF